MWVTDENAARDVRTVCRAKIVLLGYGVIKEAQSQEVSHHAV